MGLLPQPGCEPDEWPPGCESLYLQGFHLLEAALSGLVAFLPPDGTPCESEFDTLLSIGQPSVDVCDLLAGWLVNYGPSPKDTSRQRESAGMRMFAPQWIANWQFELWEAAYPIPEGTDQIRLPGLSVLNDVNRHLYAHGLAMYQAVATAVANDTLYPDGTDCAGVVLGPLMPLAPQGGCAGWKFTVDAEVPALEP